MKSIWIIQSETNIHVGNENTTSAGLIDKEIQRNVLTGIPCINASSLKGAMNEYATTKAKLSAQNRVEMFGVDKSDEQQIKETQKGNCLFFDAYLLLLPVQDDKNLYRLVTCKEVIDHYLDLLKLMGIQFEFSDLIKFFKGLDSHFKDDCLVSFEEFSEYCSNDELPIIARNCLIGNGNLWYEQALPQKSVFGTMLVCPENLNGVLNNTFNQKVVQIGANATIGYGYCRFMNIKEEE